MKIAKDFDFQTREDGNVLIEFLGDDGKTVNKQIVTPDVIRDLGQAQADEDPVNWLLRWLEERGTQ